MPTEDVTHDKCHYHALEVDRSSLACCVTQSRHDHRRNLSQFRVRQLSCVSSRRLPRARRTALLSEEVVDKKIRWSTGQDPAQISRRSECTPFNALSDVVLITSLITLIRDCRTRPEKILIVDQSPRPAYIKQPALPVIEDVPELVFRGFSHFT